MPGLKILRHMKEPGWKTMTHAERKEKIHCGCGKGEVQDMQHMMTQCKWTECMRKEIREKVADIMGSDDERKQTITEGTMEEVITIRFHERRDMHSEENSRKRCKIICKIHDDVRNILKKQRQD